MRRAASAPATTVLTASVSPLPDPQQGRTLRDYLKVVALQLHGAANPATSLMADDFAAAELEALKQAPRDSFPDEVAELTANKAVARSSRLITLAPELDEATGLIWVGGRLCCNSNLTLDAVHPIILDPKHPITRLIIQDYDKRLYHPGPERVFAEIRRKFWVL